MPVALDQELRVSGSWPLAVGVFLTAQVGLWGLMQLAWGPVVFWLIFGALEIYAAWVAYFLAKPRNRLFFNGKRLLVCDRAGRKQAHIDAPQGFVSPFYIGLQTSPWRSLGIFSVQMDGQEFARLVRWVRQRPTPKHHRHRK